MKNSIKKKINKPRVVILAFFTLLFSASISSPSYAGFGIGLGLGSTATSGEVTRVLAPVAITGLTVVGDATAPTFSWTAPVSTALNPVWSIGIYSDGTLVSVLGPNATSYALASVTSGVYPGTNHTFSVKPYNGFNAGVTSATVIQYFSSTAGSYSCPSGGTLSGSTCNTSSSVAATVVTAGGYSCPSGGSLSGTTCLTSSSYAATAGATVYSCSSGTLSGSTCLGGGNYAGTVLTAGYYSCPSGGTLSGVTCNTSSSVAATGTNNYSCSAPYVVSTGSSTCSPTTSAATGVYSCAVGATLSGTTCTNGLNYRPPTSYVATRTGYTCSVGVLVTATCYNPGTANGVAANNITYSCASGTLSGSNCITNGSYAATYTATTYICPGGGSLSGSTCVLNTGATGTTPYSCPSGGSLSGTTCTISGSYAATYTAPTYSCASGTLSGSTCIIAGSYAATLASATCASTGVLQAGASSCTIKIS